MRNNKCSMCGQRFPNQYFFLSKNNTAFDSCKKCTCAAIYTNRYSFNELLKSLDLPWHRQEWNKILNKNLSNKVDLPKLVDSYIAEIELKFKEEDYNDGEYCSPAYNPFKQ